MEGNRFADEGLAKDMKIRLETPNDIAAIEKTTLSAFTGLFSDHPTEHLIINGLRDTGALALSLVAEMDEDIVGHAAFSKVTINEEDLGWYGLGPISVTPKLQRQGIGSALTKDGLGKLREMGAKGCVLLGDPEYYQRFGFKPYYGLIYEGSPDPAHFMALPFYEGTPTGKVEYHRAFYVPA